MRPHIGGGVPRAALCGWLPSPCRAVAGKHRPIFGCQRSALVPGIQGVLHGVEINVGELCPDRPPQRIMVVRVGVEHRGFERGDALHKLRIRGVSPS